MRSSFFWFMLLMLLSGALNTMLMKFMASQEQPKVGPLPGAAAVAAAPATVRAALASWWAGSGAGLQHPYVQTLLMLVGQFVCLSAYRLCSGRGGASAGGSLRLCDKAPKRVFAVACLFDWTATTLVNMAYVCIPASVVQMCRGAAVIFTCPFLRRRRRRHHLLGVALTAVGVAAVASSAFVNPLALAAPLPPRAAPPRAGRLPEVAVAAAPAAPAVPLPAAPSAPSVYLRLLGLGLCLSAQAFYASMIVYEEKVMSGYTVPPLAVLGMEGALGVVFGSILLGLPLLVAVLGSLASVALFHYSGVVVRKQQQACATSRTATVDVPRTLVIWAAELFLGWNVFNPLQLAGFFVLAAGTMVYHDKPIALPFLNRHVHTDEDEGVPAAAVTVGGDDQAATLHELSREQQ